MSFVWFVGTAFAWEHTGFVPESPFVLELSTVDAASAPPGAVQDAVRRAVATWADDSCLETLDLQLVDTPDNLMEPTDLRNLVSVDIPSNYDAATYSSGGAFAFSRFGTDYDFAEDVDIVFGVEDWALAADVAAGTCAGPALDLAATRTVGFAMGLGYGPASAADSVFLQAGCTSPVLAADDRDALRALYGAGLDVVCDQDVVYIGYTSVFATVDDCTVGTYGTSTLLDTEWVVDGVTAYGDPSEIRMTGTGYHTLEVCGTFGVDPACDRPTTCVPIDREFLVCDPPEPAIEATVDEVGELLLRDVTVLSYPHCGLGRVWTVTDAAGGVVEVLEDEGEVEVTLPEPGVYEVQLEIGFGSFSGVASVVWAEEPGDTGTVPTVVDPGGEHEDEDEDADADEGCGCAIPVGPSGLLGLLLIVGATVSRRYEAKPRVLAR